jgi:hypothetical protein
MWDKVSALAALGCLIVALAAGIPIWITVWPWPQIKARGEQKTGSDKPFPRIKLLAFMLTTRL